MYEYLARFVMDNDRMPTVRELKKDLRSSIGAIQDGFEQLEREGKVEHVAPGNNQGWRLVDLMPTDRLARLRRYAQALKNECEQRSYGTTESIEATYQRRLAVESLLFPGDLERLS
jgi:DNA-binding transcriptional MocR family regulator